MTEPDVHLQVASVWSRILGRPKVVGPDDFFERGGSSLAAMSMLALVNARFGTAVTLSDLFEGPTLAAFAGRVERALGARRAEHGTLLVRLREGAPGAVSLVLVHPHGGSALSYLDLVARLPEDLPVHGVMARGLEIDAPAHISVADMADDYAAELLAVRADGPMVLGGFSFGAMVAFEVAVRLRLAGGAVAALLMFDPRPPPSPVGAGTPPLYQQIRRTWHIEVDEDRLRELPDDRRYRLLRDEGVAQGVLPPDMTVEMLVRRAVVRDANTTAYRAYPGDSVFSGETHVFRVTGDAPDYAMRDGIAAYWGRRLTREPVFHDVPGTHGALLKEPASLDALAAALRGLAVLRTG